MTTEKYTIFVGSQVVFITSSESDARLVVSNLQKIQELTYGLNGYTFEVEIMKTQGTTPNYTKRPGYLHM